MTASSASASRLQRLVLYSIIAAALALLALCIYALVLRAPLALPGDLRSRAQLRNIQPGMSRAEVEASLRSGPAGAAAVVATAYSLDNPASPSAGSKLIRYQADRLPPVSVIYSPEGKVVTVMPGH